jgi:hypothetical protein
MKVHLAGNDGYHRNKKFLIEAMRIFLAGSETRTWILDELDNLQDVNILESYYYLRQFESYMEVCKKCGSFLLDSGAFTFMVKNHGNVDWDAYIEEFAAFINKWDVKLFFELDIDSLVGITEVERLRQKLTDLTGKKPIPVWHKSRGKDYFIKMCKEFDYVAIGGIVTQEIPRRKYESAFPWFIKTAHDNGAKIHGLGYTSVPNLKKYHFDSIDSTTWISGNMAGKIFRFNAMNGTMVEIFAEDGKKLNSRAAALNNFVEWVRFSKYADQRY